MRTVKDIGMEPVEKDRGSLGNREGQGEGSEGQSWNFSLLDVKEDASNQEVLLKDGENWLGAVEEGSGCGTVWKEAELKRRD